jgi:hypothetical protein
MVNESQLSQSRYIDLRFDDGTHSGVRLLRGTSIIEVQRKGVKKLFDLSEYESVETKEQQFTCTQ